MKSFGGSCVAERFKFGEKVGDSSIWLFMGITGMGEFVNSVKGLP